ncbi:MAG: nuclear transport factor 2 family protein [Bdellovibrionales bacterium]|nr:nuclear transport factor 2 family protein [Bdellovibrionales bacterium]
MNKDIREVIHNQVKAYNSRNLEEFLSYFANDIEIKREGLAQPLIQGWQQLATEYKKMFEASPQLYAEILEEVVDGNTITHIERVMGRMGSDKAITVTAKYTVEDDLIKKVYFYNLITE